MKLPNAPSQYDQKDQDQMRGALEDALTKTEQRLQAWQDATGTATAKTARTSVMIERIFMVPPLTVDCSLHHERDNPLQR